MDNDNKVAKTKNEVRVVTKTKNEGRVAAGKRLAEWNRKKKGDLLKNKAQVDASENRVPNQVDASKNQVPNQVLSSHTLQYSGLAIIGLIAIAAYYFYGYKKPTSSTSSTLQPQEEIRKKPKIFLE